MRAAWRSSLGFVPWMRSVRTVSPELVIALRRPATEKSWRCSGGEMTLHFVPSRRAEIPRPWGVVT